MEGLLYLEWKIGLWNDLSCSGYCINPFLRLGHRPYNKLGSYTDGLIALKYNPKQEAINKKHENQQTKQQSNNTKGRDKVLCGIPFSINNSNVPS